MPTTIDALELQIDAEFKKADKAITDVISKLGTLNSTLSGVNASGLKDLSVGIDALFKSFKNASGIDGRQISAIAKNISKFSAVDYAKLDKISRSLRNMQVAFNNLGSVSGTTQGVYELGSAIGNLGSAKANKAIANLAPLTLGLRNMMQTLSTAPNVSRNVIRMVNALSNLASQGQTVGTVSRSLNANFRNYNTGISKATNHTLSLASAIGKFYATYFLVIRGIKNMWKAVEGSMNYVETYNYFNVATNKVGNQFKDQFEQFGYEDAEIYAESFRDRLNDLTSKMTGYSIGSNGELSSMDSKSLGLDPQQLMQFQAKTMGVTNSVGLVGEASLATSKALSMLSADLSSLTNTSLDTVMTNLSSGLIGQSRSLYKYGVDITNNTLQQYAFAQGIEKSVTEMTQAEKMQLRILAILDQSKVAWADQAWTINSVANQYRVMQQQWQNTSRVLGNLFLPIVKQALPTVNGLIIAIGRLGEQLGYSLWGTSWLKDLNDNVNNAIVPIDEDISDLESDIEGATSAAKKLKNQLRSFDELNVISTQQDSASNLLDSFDLSEQIKLSLADYESEWDKAFEEMENNALNFASKFSVSLEPIKKLFEDIRLGDWFSVGNDTSNLVSGIFNFFSDAISNVDWVKLGEQYGRFLNGLDWNKILSSTGRFVWEALKASLQLWWGSFKENQAGTLTLTFGAIALKYGGAQFTAEVLKSIVLNKLKLGSLGVAVWQLSIPLTIGFVLRETSKSLEEKLKEAIDNSGFSQATKDFYKELLPNISTDLLNPFLAFDKLFESFTQAKQAFIDLVEVGVEFRRDFINPTKDSIRSFIDSFDFKEALNKVFGFVRDLKNAFNFEWKLPDIKLPHFSISESEGLLGKIGLPSINVDWYKNGGFVPNSYTLFGAGENGVPEMVGTVGGKTAVASGAEITGISDAVYETGNTQAQLLNAMVGLLQIIATKDNNVSDEYIFNSFRKSADEYWQRTGNPAIQI